MSDLNISEAFNNVLKKTKLFEKIDTIGFNFKFFLIFTSIISLTTLNIQYSNINKINNINNELNEKFNIIVRKLEDNKNCIKNIETKIDNFNLILEEHKQILLDIRNLPLLNLNKLQTSSSTSSILSLDSPFKNEVDYQSHNNNNNNNNDDELLNECYDSIPLNNVKKINGIKGWLF